MEEEVESEKEGAGSAILAWLGLTLIDVRCKVQYQLVLNFFTCLFKEEYCQKIQCQTLRRF